MLQEKALKRKRDADTRLTLSHLSRRVETLEEKLKFADQRFKELDARFTHVRTLMVRMHTNNIDLLKGDFGYSESEIDAMTSEEYREKVMVPLGLAKPRPMRKWEQQS
jgi:hypothetical protein